MRLLNSWRTLNASESGQRWVSRFFSINHIDTVIKKKKRVASSEETASGSEACLSVSDSYQLHLRVGNWILEKHKHCQTSAAQVHMSNCFALLISSHSAIRSEGSRGACQGGAVTQPQKQNSIYLKINIIWFVEHSDSCMSHQPYQSPNHTNQFFRNLLTTHQKPVSDFRAMCDITKGWFAQLCILACTFWTGKWQASRNWGVEPRGWWSETLCKLRELSWWWGQRLGSATC